MSKMVTARLDDELVDRVDALGGKRADHLRAALEGYLSKMDGGVAQDSDGEALLAHRRPAPAAERPARKRVSKAQEESQQRFIEGRDRQHKKMADQAEVRKALSSGPVHRRELLKRLGWMEMRLDRVLSQMPKVQFREGLVWLEG